MYLSMSYYRVQQAENVIRIRVAASQEYMNSYATPRFVPVVVFVLFLQPAWKPSAANSDCHSAMPPCSGASSTPRSAQQEQEQGEPMDDSVRNVYIYIYICMYMYM